MARIRTVKPEFWTDEKIVQLPYEARLFFIGLWNFADDDGCLDYRPDRLKMQIFPDDEIDSYFMVDLLLAADLLECMVVEESKYLRIKNFKNHQKIDHPAKSKISRETSRKLSIPTSVRRELGKKYGCTPGGSKKANCYYCGLEGKIYWPNTSKGTAGYWVAFSKLEIDHLVAESNGGSTSVDNLVLACMECNRSKHNSDFIDFIAKPRETSRNLDHEWKGMEGNGKGRESSGVDGVSPNGHFDAFWDTYPKHKRVARKTCADIWKRRGLDKDAEAILNGLRQWVTSGDWTKDGGKFIPHPKTFLNQNRWEDVAAAMVVVPQTQTTDKPSFKSEGEKLVNYYLNRAKENGNV